MLNEEMIQTINNNLKKNGFPAKTVSFPSSSLASFAHKYDVSLSSLLNHLKTEQGIEYQIADERIYFTSTQAGADASTETKASTQNLLDDLSKNIDVSGLNLDELKNGNPQDMLSNVSKIMSSLDPEKLAEVQKQVADMTPEQRQQLLELAKSFGFPGSQS